jgi:dihydrofolate reductase
MGKVRVLSYSLSLDGFAAGPDQSLENPLGVNGLEIMNWVFPTHSWSSMHGKEAGERGVDNDFSRESFANVGAWILGRNMFGPVRGPWPDFEWKGWWGDEPPYRCQVFVLTHHARPPLEMKGGTVFYFVTGGIHEALARAQEAASGKDIRIGGGASTIRQYLQAKLIDDLHLAVGPVLLGSGESLFGGLDVRALGYKVARVVPGERATHVIVAKSEMGSDPIPISRG